MSALDEMPDCLDIELDHILEPFPLVSAAELTAKPTRINWVIDGILEQGSLNLLFGEPASGKSLFGLDWAFCSAAGLDWNGIKTQQTDVVIIAGEGFSGMGRRIKALEVKYQTQAPTRLFISEKPAQLLDSVNAAWIASSIKTICPNPGLIIVDTLHRNMAGDENSSQDIGHFIANIDEHLKALGAAILIVHHSGHGVKDRSRGSSSIRGAMDGEFSATKNGAGVVLTCHKSKDFEAFKPMRFDLINTKLDWLDDDGEPLTSVCLNYKGDADFSEDRPRLSARDDAILQTLSDATAAHGVEPTTAIKNKFAGFSSMIEQRLVCRIDDWRKLAYQAISVDSADDKKTSSKQAAFKRCRDKLFNQGFIVEYNDYAWRIL
jgi:RecA-family ATPase